MQKLTLHRQRSTYLVSIKARDRWKLATLKKKPQYSEQGHFLCGRLLPRSPFLSFEYFESRESHVSKKIQRCEAFTEGYFHRYSCCGPPWRSQTFLLGSLWVPKFSSRNSHLTFAKRQSSDHNLSALPHLHGATARCRRKFCRRMNIWVLTISSYV